jgi:hypothetical protein
MLKYDPTDNATGMSGTDARGQIVSSEREQRLGCMSDMCLSGRRVKEGKGVEARMNASTDLALRLSIETRWPVSVYILGLGREGQNIRVLQLTASPIFVPSPL